MTDNIEPSFGCLLGRVWH